ncbi:cysteine-rich CWC family protein [Nitrospira japonica]|nr:cysteine-rich CWC family protein [Nitrospira japonica]
MRGPVWKICERCGRSFECGQYGCWCGQMGITDRQMVRIERAFTDCLCRECLTNVVAGEEGSVSDPSSPT